MKTYLHKLIEKKTVLTITKKVFQSGQHIPAESVKRVLNSLREGGVRVVH